MTRKSRALALAGAVRDRTLVRISRRFSHHNTLGYVLDVGPAFFLLALVSDRIRFDGFECFRTRDVTDIQPDPFAGFTEAALAKRREMRPPPPRLSLESIEDLLISANREFPLVTIHREDADPDVCHIGRVMSIAHGRVSLLEINPDANWDDEPMEYRLVEITRVDFGGDYEEALHLVGGDPAPAP